MKGLSLKQPSIYLSVLLLASLFTSLFTPFIPLAKASSAYDSAYQTTPAPQLGATNYYGYNCPVQSYTFDQIDSLLNDVNTWAGASDAQTYIDSWNLAKSQGEYFISQGDNPNINGHMSYIYVGWNPNPYWTLQWDTSVVNVVNPSGSPTFYTQLYNHAPVQGGSGCQVEAASYRGNTTSSTGQTISNSTGGYWLNYQTKIFNVTYPDGYAGMPLATATVPKTVVRPDYDYSVNIKSITLTDTSSPPPDHATDYKLHFLVTIGTFETQTYYYEGTIDKGSSATIQSPVQDKAGVQMWYTDNNGVRLEDTTQTDYRETDVSFDINGSSFHGSTTGTTCDDNDHCTVPEKQKYKDCSVYNIDVKFFDTGISWKLPTPETVGCMVNNFWIMLSDFIGSFFMPATDPDNPFANWNTDDHGLLSVITAPLAVFTNLQSSQQQCTPLSLPLPYVNRNLDLPCMTPLYQTMFGSMFTMYQTIASGIISYYVLLKYLELIKGIKDPQNDKIEATAL